MMLQILRDLGAVGASLLYHRPLDLRDGVLMRSSAWCRPVPICLGVVRSHWLPISEAGTDVTRRSLDTAQRRNVHVFFFF